MMIRSRIFCLLSVLTLATSTPLWLRPDVDTRVSTSSNLNYYLLPVTIKPTLYEVYLIPYFETPAEKSFTFDGSVKIDFVVLEDTNLIKLHAHIDITINEASITLDDEDGPIIDPFASITRETDDRSFMELTTKELLKKDFTYSLFITYKSILNDELEGFYRSTYIDVQGNEKWMAVTQFEEMGARRAFPCFDEPIWKAKFKFHIAHAPEHKVLSNMPTDGDDTPYLEIPNWSWTHFKQTAAAPELTGKDVVMSTYLAAFTVSDFQSSVNPDDDRFKVWSRPGTQHQGWYASNVSPYVVKFMENFTGHAYSLPKIDQIAIPDFSAGAMENWGLITYRESRILFEEGVSSSLDRQGIETVVTHELAHQWFGNIISPTWWSHIWLNEGFATYFEYHALATIEETWQLEQQFILIEMHSVLGTDALNSTHAMVADVDNPSSASAVFDNIAYNKGACIVRFMISLMGETNFKRGIKDYLTDMEFKNAEPADLWRNLRTYVLNLPRGVSFATVMNTWVENVGYPVVTVHRTYGQDTAVASVSQERFTTERDPNYAYDEKWWVALTMTSRKSPGFEPPYKIWSWLKENITNLALGNNIGDNDWVLFNVKQVGYYRVNYDVKNWRLLSAAQLELHPINRAQLMDDALALARTELLDYPTALNTTNYLTSETEYMPWAAALSATSFLYDRLNYQQSSRDLFQLYMLSKMDNIYDLVNGFAVSGDDSHILKLKRSVILRWACEYRHKDCNNEAVAMFKEWQAKSNPDTENPIEPDLKRVVYCAGMRQGGRSEYNFLFARYNETDVATEKSLIISALGCASDPALLNEYLYESIKVPSVIRPQDARFVFSAVYNNYLGVDLALDFIVTNWEKCVEVYASNNNVARAFTGVSKKCNTEEQKAKLADLYADNSVTTMDKVIYNALGDAITTVDEAIAWHDQYEEEVLTYLEDNIPTGSASSLTPTLLLCTLTFLLFRP